MTLPPPDSPDRTGAPDPPPHPSSRWQIKLIAFLISALAALGAAEIFIRHSFKEEVDSRFLNLVEDNHFHMEGLCYPSDDLMTHPFEIEDGYLILPTRPGLGSDLIEEELIKHAATGDFPGVR